jgi:hypothetical protein
MNDERRIRVQSATIEISGQEFEIFFVGFEDPTEHAAASAWERAESRRHHGDFVSVFRLSGPDQSSWLVVAISEDEIAVRTARRLLKQGGLLFDPDHDLLQRLLMRRIRVAAQTAGPGDSMQRARYGKSGAVLGDDGQLRPFKRPQG